MRREQWEALKDVLVNTKDYAQQERKRNCTTHDEGQKHWQNSHESLSGMVKHMDGEYCYHSILNNQDVTRIIKALEQLKVEEVVTHDPVLDAFNTKERERELERLIDKMKLMYNHWVWRSHDA